jgi:hypothetical protein
MPANSNDDPVFKPRRQQQRRAPKPQAPQPFTPETPPSQRTKPPSAIAPPGVSTRFPVSPQTRAGGLLLPETLSLQFPDFQSLIPTDWFKPSSSSVPRTTSAEFNQEKLIAEEQGNSLVLMGMNLENATLAVGNAVKATKVGNLILQYELGIEKMRTTEASIHNQQTATANERIKGDIQTEKGRSLTLKLAGEQIRTGIEGAKNALSQAELGYHTDLLPVREKEWQNLLLQAQQKAELALNGVRAV